MRGLVLASLFLAVLAHTEQPAAGRARKSLGFGPAHPHAVYKSSPYQIATNGFTSQDPSTSPYEVAGLFLNDLLRDQLSESNSYKIREDSYVDKNTGVAHVYVRQVVNGLEVADGDINLNIKDGVVLSYGNSVSRALIMEQTCIDHSHTVLPRNYSCSFCRSFAERREPSSRVLQQHCLRPELPYSIAGPQ